MQKKKTYDVFISYRRLGGAEKAELTKGELVKRGCKYFSLACTCQNLGINFFDYFSDILGKCAAMPNGAASKAYRNLLPDKWTKAQQGTNPAFFMHLPRPRGDSYTSPEI